MNGLHASQLTPAEAAKPQPLIARLSDIDWSFASARSPRALDNLHPYPAKFIPELPGALLDALPLPHNAVVMDPFAGSGTTLAEAQRRGLQSVGIDLNPIACLISRVRTAPLAPQALGAAQAVVDRAVVLSKVVVPAIPNLDHWFETSVQDVVARIILAIQEAPAVTHDFLNLALSSILVRVSNQDSDTRYAAVTKNVNAAGVYKAFLAAANRIEAALSIRGSSLPRAAVLEQDTLQVTAVDIGTKIDAVITSPPYPNAYEYWLYHKYRMWWLGYDPLAVKAQEIGARANFFGGKKHTAFDFERQMAGTFSLVANVLKPDGFACFVVGRSKIHGEIVDNAALIRTVGQTYGFREIFSTERVISSTRKSFNLSHANIKTETVLVLGR